MGRKNQERGGSIYGSFMKSQSADKNICRQSGRGTGLAGK